MFRKYELHKKWQGTPIGETMLAIQRLHKSLAAQSGKEQEATRQQIEDLARALREAGVYGKYDLHLGRFVEDSPGRRIRRQG